MRAKSPEAAWQQSNIELQRKSNTYLVSFDFNVVSAENKLMPLSVFIEGHLFVNFLEAEAPATACSGIERECFIAAAIFALLELQLGSCALLRAKSGHGDTVPGDRCGVKSDHTRDTC